MADPGATHGGLDHDGAVDASARVHETAIVESGASVGARTSVWDNVHVRSGARIGNDCIVGEKTYLAYDVVIGDLCKINASVYLCAGTVVEDGVMVSAHVVFTNDRTPRATDPDIQRLRPSAPDEDTAGATVRLGASIGANATIGPDVTIGAYAMVGMGSVVTRDVPDFALVVGNPARVVGVVDRSGAVIWRGEPGQMPALGTRLRSGDGSEEYVVGDGRVVSLVRSTGDGSA